jgi:hypothetical protein
MTAEDNEVRVASTREDETEEYSFDALAKGLASGTISRRKALKLAGAAILGGGVLALFPQPAEAAECGNSAGCGLRCKNTGKCRCVRTTANNVRCVRPCCSGRTCNNSGDCRSKEVCMTTSCCGSPGGKRGVCVTKCHEPRPGYCDRRSASGTNTETPAPQWSSDAA